MNKHKLSVLGFSLLLLITSCKKNDVQHEDTTTNPTAITAPAITKASEWRSFTNWTSSKEEKFTSHSSKVTDSTITNAVATSGLVLAFSKAGNTIQALPFQEKGTNDSYWYYQISKDAITLSCDSYKGTAPVNTTEFKYFVFTPDQLKDLETKGYSKMKLLQLTYEEVAALTN
jgi:hypothetical protein